MYFYKFPRRVAVDGVALRVVLTYNFTIKREIQSGLNNHSFEMSKLSELSGDKWLSTFEMTAHQ